MQSTTWHVRVTFVQNGITPETMVGTLESLEELSPAGSVDLDGAGGEIGVFVDAATPMDAAADAARLVSTAVGAGTTVVGVAATTEDEFLSAASRPQFPEVVGYAEIAEMAGVSRQRARAFAGSPGFPPAIVETRQGPLMARAAVEAWVERRNTRPGRPRKVG